VVGLLVVAIALMGLVSALTMGVIERTREIGVLRCLGARASHVRRVFGAEGVVIRLPLRRATRIQAGGALRYQ
jgi:ABC-type lipoprotein release transport system permease subunit